MTVDCVDGFIYPDHIRKIAIFGFLSMYPELADIRYLRKVLNCKNSSKVNFKNADIYKVHIFLN
jgi:hypothetical protein